MILYGQLFFDLKGNEKSNNIPLNLKKNSVILNLVFKAKLRNLFLKNIGCTRNRMKLSAFVYFVSFCQQNLNQKTTSMYLGMRLSDIKKLERRKGKARKIFADQNAK